MGEDRETEAALNCYAHENRELRAEVERLKGIGEGLAAVATGGDAMLARADDFARRARGSEHDRLPELFYEAIGEGRMAMTSEVERLKREAQEARRARQIESVEHWRRNCFAWKEKSDETERECERLRSERDAARRAGMVEGLREAAEILRGAAETDARNAVHCSAPNHRERLQNLSENELVMAYRMLTRAEEVERNG